METETTISHGSPPSFNSENYETWAIRLKVHLEVLDFWEAVEENYVVPDLTANLIVAQLKIYKEKKTRKSKAKACLYATVPNTIFHKDYELGFCKGSLGLSKKGVSRQRKNKKHASSQFN